MTAFKFQGHREAGKLFAGWMAEALSAAYDKLPGFDWVACVPMQPERQAQRGYNQAEVLARELADLLPGRPVPAPSLLLRRDGLTQHTLSARMRRLEAKTAFAAADPAAVTGKRILLVDDIYTTGSTMRECAWRLRDAGALSVCCVSAAITRNKY